MMQTYFFFLYFFAYGFLGWCTEVGFAAVKQHKFVNRGFLNGPICPIYGVGVGIVVQFLHPYADNLVLLYVASTVLVTLIEGVTGYFMDKIFHHKWWDYSKQPLNIGGYVCVIFSLVWGVACVVIVKLIHPFIHRALEFIPVIAGVIFIAVLCVVLFADVYVTAAGILKLNRRLDAMERIAVELRGLSEKVGENIYENVIETMEKLDDVAEERKARAIELKEKYAQLALGRMKVGDRLMKAFPKMESRMHRDILNELKERVKRARR